MTEDELLAKIQSLVDRQHELRDRRERGEVSREDEQAQIKQLEQDLDQTWDLLRQRRAKAEFGQDPDAARARPTEQVEGYRQ